MRQALFWIATVKGRVSKANCFLVRRVWDASRALPPRDGDSTFPLWKPRQASHGLQLTRPLNGSAKRLANDNKKRWTMFVIWELIAEDSIVKAMHNMNVRRINGRKIVNYLTTRRRYYILLWRPSRQKQTCPILHADMNSKMAPPADGFGKAWSNYNKVICARVTGAAQCIRRNSATDFLHRSFSDRKKMPASKVWTER